MKQKSASKLLCSLIVALLLFSFFPASMASAANSPFSDVNDRDYYASEVFSMYNQGIINSYGDGRFLLENSIKNSEAIKLVLSVAGINYAGYTGKTSPWYSDCMEWAYSSGIAHRENDPNPYTLLDYSHYIVARPEKLNTYDDFVNAWCWMLVNSSFNESFRSDITCHVSEIEYIIDKVVESFNYALFEYMDYSSFFNSWSVRANYSINNKNQYHNINFTLSLENAQGIPNSTIAWQIPAFENTCADIVASLYKSGELHPSMSIKEKAYALYVYTALLLEYDTSYTNYTGYDAAVSNIAVCQGYTAMYNYLCNLAGVPMRGMIGDVGVERHAWSRIYDGGVWYNVDTTWADPIPNTMGYWDDYWFWLTDDEIKYGPDPRTFDIDCLGYGL
ncbi:MAG: hypothetical protein GX025_06075 [Clostridiales bacterium]|nr:hypothetical protein [Clostridiales bacterium]